MLDAIEHFAGRFQHTSELLTAIGTLGAVLVSLWLAWRADRAARTRLKAFANLKFILDKTGTADSNDARTFLAVTITNIGNWPLRIPMDYFNWMNPLQRGYMMVLPMDAVRNKWFPVKQYPLEIAPRASETFYLADEAMFLAEAKRMKAADDSPVARLGFRFIRAYVLSDDKSLFRVKLSKEVRAGWRKA
jgi:hypothetical protein